MVAAENTLCKHYCSEKVWLPLARGSIAVVRGCFAVAQWAPARGAIIQVKAHPI